MNSMFKKLNYSDQAEVYVLNAPASFQPNTDEIAASATVKTDMAKAKAVRFAIAFATKQAEVDRVAKQAAKALEGDAVLWIAYPKGTSKTYTCEFNRDTGWASLGAAGFEPVRQVAIDEDWSALRFRRVEYIKSMTRSFAMTKAGKEKVAARRKK